MTFESHHQYQEVQKTPIQLVQGWYSIVHSIPQVLKMAKTGHFDPPERGKKLSFFKLNQPYGIFLGVRMKKPVEMISLRQFFFVAQCKPSRQIIQRRVQFNDIFAKRLHLNFIKFYKMTRVATRIEKRNNICWGARNFLRQIMSNSHLHTGVGAGVFLYSCHVPTCLLVREEKYQIYAYNSFSPCPNVKLVAVIVGLIQELCIALYPRHLNRDLNNSVGGKTLLERTHVIGTNYCTYELKENCF